MPLGDREKYFWYNANGLEIMNTLVFDFTLFMTYGAYKNQGFSLTQFSGMLIKLIKILFSLSSSRRFETLTIEVCYAI